MYEILHIFIRKSTIMCKIGKIVFGWIGSMRNSGFGRKMKHVNEVCLTKWSCNTIRKASNLYAQSFWAFRATQNGVVQKNGHFRVISSGKVLRVFLASLLLNLGLLYILIIKKKIFFTLFGSGFASSVGNFFFDGSYSKFFCIVYSKM
jgi:hypothetical protein